MVKEFSTSKIRMLMPLVCLLLFMGIHPVALGDWEPGEPYKWYQTPDLTPTGIDICVDDTDPTGQYPEPQRTIGDDFECTETGPITDVHFWGSWRNDVKGRITAIHIRFYSDDPVGPGGSNPQNEWSTPDILLWERWFDESQFVERLYYTMPDGSYEGWWDPRTAGSYTPLGDTQVYQYNIDILDNPFIQEGSPDNPIIYWLVIEVKIDQTILNSSFGWKTRYRWNTIEGGGHFMDDAVWYGAQWVDIEYPPGHEYYPDSVDMAFVLTSEQHEELDFGDAPDSPTAVGYPTLLINNGARHIIGGPWLGDSRDAPDPEPDGQPDPSALGDDNDGNDDENGVQIPVLTAGQVAAAVTFEVNSADGLGGTVSGWIDFNGNQIWGDVANEQIIAASYPNGVYTVTFNVPPTAVIGQTFARIRISRDMAAMVPTGQAADGEVEDYEVFIEQEVTELELKFQQLPLNGVIIDDIAYYGHDELSSAYSAYDDLGFIGFEGCYMADDFADLRHAPVVAIRWWGSYLENEIMEPVTRFLIAFETDVPAVGQPGSADYVPSHPGEVIQSQIVTLSTVIPLNQGQYSEIPIGPGGPPCYETLYEYRALLANPNPFREFPDTVYWIKIVALIDIPEGKYLQIQSILQQSGIALCDFLNLPFAQQQQMGLSEPITRWGWHDRDYTIQDPLASVPPAVVPGEHDASLLPWTLPIGDPPIEVWHFQDDAVSGEVFVDRVFEPDPYIGPMVIQPTWQEEYYKYFNPLCGAAIQGVDGPEGIETYSKDLAFELWTTTNCRWMLTPAEQVDYDAYVAVGQDPSCWCWAYQCRGDANHDTEGLLTKYRVYTNDMNRILLNWKRKFTTIPPADPCADVGHDSEGTLTKYRVYTNDMNLVLTNWKKKDSQLVVCPSSLE